MDKKVKIFWISILLNDIHVDIANYLFKIFGVSEGKIKLNKEIKSIFMHFILQKIIRILESNPSAIFVCDNIDFNYEFYKYIDKENCILMIDKIIKQIKKNLMLNMIFCKNINKLCNLGLDYYKDIINNCEGIYKESRLKNKNICSFNKIKKYTNANKLIQMHKYFYNANSNMILQGERL